MDWVARYFAAGLFINILVPILDVIATKARGPEYMMWLRKNNPSEGKPFRLFTFAVGVLLWPAILALYFVAGWHRETITGYWILWKKKQEEKEAKREEALKVAKQRALQKSAQLLFNEDWETIEELDQQGFPVEHSWSESFEVGKVKVWFRTASYLDADNFKATLLEGTIPDTRTLPVHVVVRPGLVSRYLAYRTSLELIGNELTLPPDKVCATEKEAQAFCEDDKEWLTLSHPQNRGQMAPVLEQRKGTATPDGEQHPAVLGE